MRKTVLGMAAVATLSASAGVADAAPIKAGVRGFHNEYFAGAYQSIDPVPGGDDPDVAYVDHHFDNEVHFRGETTLDNGVTFGFRVELEGRTTSDQIDEAYITAEGGFGRFVIGDENSAPYLMHYSQALPTTIDLQETEIEFLNGVLPGSFDLADTAIDSTLMRGNDNDSGKVIYLTPRLAGLQLGVSYAAIAEGGGDDNSSIRDGDQWNNVGIGANYEREIGGVGFGISGGVIYADTSQAGPADGADDLYGVNAGTFIEVGGFTINGAFAYMQGDEGVTGPRGGATERALLFDSWGYNISGTYEVGAWMFGAGYQRGKSSGLQGDGERNTLDQYLVGMSYALGPGIKWEVTGMYWDAAGEKRDLVDDDENGVFDDGPQGDFVRTDGIGVTTGLALTF